jgi:hypothetical protein
MKMDFESTCSERLVLKKGELVVVFKPFETSNIWSAYTTYGGIGCIDTMSFNIIPDKPIFKFKSHPEIIKYIACSEAVKEDFSLINVDYCSIVNRIISKDLKALTEFFDLIPKVDAALAETHASQTWTIINLYSDKELLSWIKTLDNKRLTQFVCYLTNEFDGIYDAYLSFFYPKSWRILKEFK